MESRPPDALDRDSPADVELALRELRRGLAQGREPDRFDVEELLDRERVVQLDHVEVVRRDSGVVERDADRLACERGVEVLASVHGL